VRVYVRVLECIRALDIDVGEYDQGDRGTRRGRWTAVTEAMLGRCQWVSGGSTFAVRRGQTEALVV
jgi:hypothetical protein